MPNVLLQSASITTVIFLCLYIRAHIPSIVVVTIFKYTPTIDCSDKKKEFQCCYTLKFYASASMHQVVKTHIVLYVIL